MLHILMWIAIVTGAAACLAAIAARSLRSFSRRELEERCEARRKEARFADILHHHERVAMPVEIGLVEKDPRPVRWPAPRLGAQPQQHLPHDPRLAIRPLGRRERPGSTIFVRGQLERRMHFRAIVRRGSV